jgi:outer membrane protein OmpA-like peptidoglycan-associated protein
MKKVMARNRLNPWPSIADLFSALMVVSLAALIIIVVKAVRLTQPELVERDAARVLAEAFARKVSKPNAPVREKPCPDRLNEQCLEIAFRFKTDSDQLSTAGIDQVKEACEMYKQAVDDAIGEISKSQKNRLHQRDFVLLIEGHTDNTVPPHLTGRDSFLYNWKLSSERAAEVLYQFKQNGVSPEDGYQISSIGLAATRPVCTDSHPTSQCLEQNRRTTMRIRVETSSPSSN